MNYDLAAFAAEFPWFFPVCATVWQKLSGKKAPIAPRAEDAGGKETETLGLGVHVPFGPMLAAGAAVYFLAASGWFDAYVAGLGELF